MTIIDIPQSISIVLAAPVPDVLTSCSLVPPTPPPAPPTSGIIYTPVAPGITYAALPTVIIVDTSPDQIIGCIHDTADNPQGRLNVLFPSAINGDGVIERRNNDIWVYNGTIWNNVGPAPGPTIQTVPTLILPYNETAIYEGRLRLGNVVTKFEYALEVLTTVPALVLQTSVDVRRIRKVEVPAAGTITLAAQTPAVSTTIVIAPPATTFTLAPLAPAVAGGASVSVPLTTFTLSALVPENVGPESMDVLVPTATITLAALDPSVNSGVSVAVPAGQISISGLAPSRAGNLGDEFSLTFLLGDDLLTLIP